MSDIVPTQPGDPTEPEEFLRARCQGCNTEVSCTGSRQNFSKLLERNKWHLGATMLCPDCAQKRKRKFLEDQQT